MNKNGKNLKARKAARKVRLTPAKTGGARTVKKVSKKRPARSATSRAVADTVRTKKPKKPAMKTRIAALLQSKIARAALIMAFFLAAGAGIGAGAKAAWSWMIHSPRFAVKEIIVHTGPRVTEQEVRMLADLNEGDNILGFSLSDIVAGVEIHPWVKSASVMRQFPDRVVIDVLEREPVAVVSLGSLYYLGQDGEIFKKLLPGEEFDYPVVTGITLRDVVDADTDKDPLLSLAVDILKVADNARVMGVDSISEINLHPTYGATLIRVSDGMIIRVGFGDLEDKWFRLERTLVELGKETEKVAELDLNYESRVTVRLRQGYKVASAGSEDTPGGL
jgi:cell division septal protein FtsQ